MENYEKLRSIIQAANPEIKQRVCPVCESGSRKLSGYCSCGAFLRDREIEREIRLADVLLAIQKEFLEPNLSIINYAGVEELLNLWNHFYDNLDHQPDETKQFLIDLLVTGSQ